MKKLFSVLMNAVLSGLSAKAQFNDSIHHYIRYAATGIINRTNTAQSYLIANTVRYNQRKKNKSINFNGSYIYGRQMHEVSNNDFSSALDFNLFPKDSSKLYYWGLLNFDKTYSLNLNSRLQSGLGAAYNFFDNQQRFLNISEGVLYEKSNLKLTDSTTEINTILRNSLRLRYRFVLGKIVVVDGSDLLQNSLRDKSDYIVKLTNNVSVRLRSWLSFTTAFTYNRISLTAQENLLITFGLSAEKYF